MLLQNFENNFYSSLGTRELLLRLFLTGWKFRFMYTFIYTKIRFHDRKLWANNLENTEYTFAKSFPWSNPYKSCYQFCSSGRIKISSVSRYKWHDINQVYFVEVVLDNCFLKSCIFRPFYKNANLYTVMLQIIATLK